jgi:NAD(P)-dependent dehydrogenase (short-subunit alcohol dehydrogenase family)
MAAGTKTVLITGASGDIGRALVRRLDELGGWRVLAAVRSLDAGEELARGSTAVVPVKLDICDDASVAAARDDVAGRLDGRGLDALVNNAGVSADGPLELVSIEALRRQFDVNVIGQVAVTQAFLPELRRARGRVINMGGAAGRLTVPMYGGLSASKAALDSLTNALRMELKYQGVRVSYVEPGALGTDFFQRSAEVARRDGQTGSPESQRIYEKAIEASAKAIAGSRTSPVDAAVGAIVKALSARRPAARYIVGIDARLGLMFLPRFPAGVRDRVLMANLKLGRKTFDA